MGRPDFTMAFTQYLEGQKLKYGRIHTDNFFFHIKNLMLKREIDYE
jgi:hypothetical protein